MNSKYQFMKHQFEGAKLVGVLSPEEVDSLLYAARTIFNGQTMAESYQTIPFDKVCRILDADRKVIEKLWQDNNMPILKFYRAQQSSCRVFLSDLIQMFEIMKENKQGNQL